MTVVTSGSAVPIVSRSPLATPNMAAATQRRRVLTNEIALATMRAMGSGHSLRDGRVAAVDASRGAAMLLVFLAHFADTYYLYMPVSDQRHRAVGLLTRIASPAFVWL